jgi:hypothetical protein
MADIPRANEEFKAWLNELEPCEHLLHAMAEWVGARDFAQAWKDCPRGDWLIDLAWKLRLCDRRALTLAACLCARRYLPYDRNGYEQSVKMIEAAEAWLANPCEDTRKAAEETTAGVMASIGYSSIVAGAPWAACGIPGAAFRAAVWPTYIPGADAATKAAEHLACANLARSIIKPKLEDDPCPSSC